MAYRFESINIPFPELGDDVQVTMIDPRLLPWEAKVKLGKRARIVDGKPSVDPDAIAEVIPALVTGWTVYDPRTGEQLKKPEEDPAGVLRCPSIIIEGIMRKYNESLRAEQIPKNSSDGSANS